MKGFNLLSYALPPIIFLHAVAAIAQQQTDAQFPPISGEVKVDGDFSYGSKVYLTAPKISNWIGDVTLT